MKFDRLWPERILWQVAALVMTFLFVGPIVWVLASSLRPIGLPPPRTLEWLPEALAWSNYLEIFRVVPLGQQVGNSLWVSTIGAALTLPVFLLAWLRFGIGATGAMVGPRDAIG